MSLSRTSRENLSLGILKAAFSATETSLKSEFSLVASFDMILSNKRIRKALIRLHGCAGWSAPLLFANPPKIDTMYYAISPKNLGLATLSDGGHLKIGKPFHLTIIGSEVAQW